MVPPVTNSTGTPVSLVNFLAAVSATRSRQLPPQMLMTSLSCACAGMAMASAKSASKKRFMCKSSVHSLHRIECPALRHRIILHQPTRLDNRTYLAYIRTIGGQHVSSPKEIIDGEVVCVMIRRPP